MAPKFHTLTVEEIIRETEDTVSIKFDVPSELSAEFDYIAGQYLTLKKDMDGEDVRRSYSLCSAPYENEWRVAVKQVEGGKFSTYVNTVLKEGDQLEVMTPMGNFAVRPDSNSNKNYVLIAAGSGITPVLSILKTVLKEEPESNVTLLYGNKGINSIIFKEEIEGLKNTYIDRLRVVHVFSRESLGTPILKGRIDAAKMDELYESFLKRESIDGVYLCGPEGMIMDAKESLISKGIKKEAIHFELFTSSAPKKEVEVSDRYTEVQSNVTIIMDGDEYDLHLESSGQAILDAAQETGADLPFACKGGVCCTCKAKILEGTARMDVNYALEPDEVNAGYILTCQAHPTSDKLIVSFDD